ncbi:MAG: ATP-binding protein [Candidatus Cloacimonadales bacterium]|nr:ATP-binding protein [Candidatus Cloacimonadales bacterium]
MNSEENPKLLDTYKVNIKDQELNQRINDIFYTNVKALAFAFTLLFLIFSIGHLTLFRANINMVRLTIMSFLILFAILNLLTAIKFPHKFSHPAGTLIVLVVLINSITYIKMSNDIIYIVYILLIIIGCGIFFLSFTWYFISVVFILLAVVFELVLKEFQADWKMIVTLISLSFYVSMIANYLRIRSMRSFQKLYMLSTKHEKVLEKAMQKIDSINRELKDFAHIVSHDLKAPLRGIRSLATWLISDYSEKFDEDGKAQLDLMINRVVRMDNLIDGVLQYSRIGRVEEEKVEINLAEEVPLVIDLLAVDSSIEIKIVDKLPVVKFEKTRIEQVFQNFLSNAVKYMDKPEGKIEIGCKDDGNFWRFYVKDNGPGIEEINFEKIFKIFHTLQSRDQYESTGIGLTVIKKIVEMYGGQIWVESQVGKGSTFFFTLPKSESN